ncbi:hypothetical protein HDU85_005071 [Gaertneriomyces sp. JEL0708]|nr:hypothetical protein HDU85_005071 [Gaertneriomyces sp. JEL0708]
MSASSHRRLDVIKSHLQGKGPKLLIANRGEIAVRIARAAADLVPPIRTVAVYSEDDGTSLHIKKCDEALSLKGVGALAYLDIEQIILVAKKCGADFIHPGYGFLSENAAFAKRCEEESIGFVGPSSEMLRLYGDKLSAKELAKKVNVPTVPGTTGPTSLADTVFFFNSLPPSTAMIIKSVVGGGGRGMRVVKSSAEISDAYTRCRSEAKASFGNDDVYVEMLVNRARHIEVQIIGDGEQVVHLWERECSLQRRNQKVIEIAPCPNLDVVLRHRIIQAAVAMAKAGNYKSLGTFEFLVPLESNSTFFFIETNPRIQVEHTVTEEVTGFDLVQAQLRIALGSTLNTLGLSQANIPEPATYAIQLRVNTETILATGEAVPSFGTITHFDVPSGRGIRVETAGYSGFTLNPSFDSLLAKLITFNSRSYTEAVHRARRVLSEFRIGGVQTNVGFLYLLLGLPEVQEGRAWTSFIQDSGLQALKTGKGGIRRYFDTEPTVTVAAKNNDAMGPHGSLAITTAVAGNIVSVDVKDGDEIKAGQQVAVVSAMKMEHVVTASSRGKIAVVAKKVGDIVPSGASLMFFYPSNDGEVEATPTDEIDLNSVRSDLQQLLDAHQRTSDGARPLAIAKRHKQGHRTAWENVSDLVDDGTWIEFGSLALAAQRSRRTDEELLRMTPRDGIITGLGSINGPLFNDVEKTRAAVLAYDYTVLAGTQGFYNHRKKDRIFRLAQEWRIPVVIFCEGGGGRPGDTDVTTQVAGLDVITFWDFGELSGLVPLVGIANGRCFAGNAALLGCCDVIIATENSNIGMGGPAMIEGGGLGTFRPEDVGPSDVHIRNGVIDVLVKNEMEAVQVAKKYLAYFQGAVPTWTAQDQRMLRHLVPENRLRTYDIRRVIEALADENSVLELRKGFGIGMITSFVRITGQPFGLIANNPLHLGGAIDTPAAEKAGRFLQLCDAFDIPVISLCDTPGFMVGPDAEKNAQVRKFARLFVVGGSLSVPFFTVVLRKGYGLGAQSMAGGSFQAPFFIISWPTGEFGGMGPEGAVRLAFKNELNAVEDPVEREKLFQSMVNDVYTRGKAIEMARCLEIDQVIDPAETRKWIMAGWKMCPKSERKPGKKRSMVDTW